MKQSQKSKTEWHSSEVKCSVVKKVFSQVLHPVKAKHHIIRAPLHNGKSIHKNSSENTTVTP